MTRPASGLLAGLVLLAAPAWAQSNAGDIPDSQVFVTYRAPAGFSLQVPEGWARTDGADGVRFVDHYDVVAVQVAPAPAPPVAAGVRPPGTPTAPAQTVSEPGGAAVRLVYRSTSAPNPVTGKAVALENEQYLFWRGGKLATLTLSAPQGADNVDQWRLMSRSFRWN